MTKKVKKMELGGLISLLPNPSLGGGKPAPVTPTTPIRQAPAAPIKTALTGGRPAPVPPPGMKVIKGIVGAKPEPVTRTAPIKPRLGELVPTGNSFGFSMLNAANAGASRTPSLGGSGPIAPPANPPLRQAGNPQSGTATMKKGGSVKSSASKRADGCAVRGKTKGRMV